MIIRITGGIGNQMFQYALKLKFDCLLQHQNKIDTRFYEKKDVHNGYELDAVFGIDANRYKGKIHSIADKYSFFYKVCFKLGVQFLKQGNVFTEIRTGFSNRIFEQDVDYCYLDGYWQSEDYFKDIELDIRNVFRFPEFTEQENIELMNKISGKNSVSLHVRRGDYVDVPRYVALGKTQYYQNAVDYIKERVDNPIFVILSDDILWCKQNLNLPENIIYVDWNHGTRSYRDMQIMSRCKHNIIANSSFSWWGAWLNSNLDKIVVSPERFFNGKMEDDSHIIPKEWVKLSI